ncbi:MAG TPA: D-alanyl-D-alanine carboxypeptidase family protein [Solirubrobacteraceae bacterium]|jgi:D-alanyl-D-alanine carboxypeptidase|nr:D-alanyl-D-alanine carboxypeptidase family protein [Solirubrobacteraceae bacterium]
MSSRSPFMTPDQSRRRRRLARERRRRRRTIGFTAFALLVLLAVGVALAASKSGGGSSGDASSASAKPVRPKVALKPALSAIGLPLGKSPLSMQGLGLPQQDAVHIDFHHPPRAGILFDLSTGQVLWQRNPYQRLRVASLTKMMTALLTVESAPPDARVLVTKAAVNSAGSKVGVLPLGKHVRLETMLYGLLLPSGNDAAIALAQHVAGSIESFVKRMNARAAQLGMGCTRYSSPSGYFNANNFSCAADLALLAHVDEQQPRIARVVRTYSRQLPLPIKGGKVYLYNNNPLLIYHYPGVTGLKTGFTDSAGRCLVATAERGGVRLGVVVLHSPNPGTQARQLLDRGFQGVYHQAPVVEPPMPPGA